jgi:hypothetical protein
LPGDRRVVKQANQILDENNRVLLQAIGGSMKAPIDGDEEQRPLLH